MGNVGLGTNAFSDTGLADSGSTRYFIRVLGSGGSANHCPRGQPPMAAVARKGRKRRVGQLLGS